MFLCVNRKKSNVDMGEGPTVEENVTLLQKEVENISLEDVDGEDSENLISNFTKEEDDEEFVTHEEREAFLMLHFKDNFSIKSSVQFNLSNTESGSDTYLGKEFQDESVQFCTNDFTFSFISLINSDEVLNTLTGISTLNLLEVLVKAARKV